MTTIALRRPLTAHVRDNSEAVYLCAQSALRELGVREPEWYERAICEAAAGLVLSETGSFRDDFNEGSTAAGPLQVLDVAYRDWAQSLAIYQRGGRIADWRRPPDRLDLLGFDDDDFIGSLQLFVMSAVRYGARMKEFASRGESADQKTLLAACALALSWAGGPSKVTSANASVPRNKARTPRQDVVAAWKEREKDYSGLFMRSREKLAKFGLTAPTTLWDVPYSSDLAASGWEGPVEMVALYAERAATPDDAPSYEGDGTAAAFLRRLTQWLGTARATQQPLEGGSVLSRVCLDKPEWS